MRPLEYKRDMVLEKLQENRAAHAMQVQRAWEGYWTQASEMLQRQKTRVEGGKPLDQADWRSVPEPQDYTKEYDQAIAQLQAAYGDFVTLDDMEFRRFMQNQWEWTPQFTASTQRYTS